MIRRPPKSPLFPYADALPIWRRAPGQQRRRHHRRHHLPPPPLGGLGPGALKKDSPRRQRKIAQRSEEHTSELQSRQYLVCRLLLEKKTKYAHYPVNSANLFIP